MKVSTASGRGTMGRTFALKVERLSGMSHARKRAIVDRSAARFTEVRPLVERVIRDVKRDGDVALFRHTIAFDKVDLSKRGVRVGRNDIARARKTVLRESADLIPAIEATLECIRGYHEGELAQLKSGLVRWERKIRSSRWPKNCDIKVGQLRVPIERVGVYVPGGNAVLLTTALMAVTPAKVAGVPEIVLSSPPSRDGDIDPRIIVAADMAGADVIIRAGGAQAIAAMAYGTESVPRVHKIVGPGNIYVAAAKAFVAAEGVCGVDLPAGPSEVFIIADKSADVECVVRDMLSQSEHDENACAVLVTISHGIAESVRARIEEELNAGAGAGAGTAARAITRNGAILIADSLSDAVSFANEFAPEHLEIMTAKPRSLLSRVRNAGGIFLGMNSPVAIGDYVCPNHILPTGGAARYTSGVSIDTFLKKPSVLEVPAAALQTLDRLVEVLSKAEGLYAQHGLSVKARADRARRKR